MIKVTTIQEKWSYKTKIPKWTWLPGSCLEQPDQHLISRPASKNSDLESIWLITVYYLQTSLGHEHHTVHVKKVMHMNRKKTMQPSISSQQTEK